MSTRLLSPLKRKNSSQYRFRMVVPPYYRGQVGKAEIKQPLCTDDLGEARRLGTARQYDWLKKFELIKLGLKARDTLAGTDAIDGYLALLWQKFDFRDSHGTECVIHGEPALMEAGDGRGVAGGS